MRVTDHTERHTLTLTLTLTLTDDTERYSRAKVCHSWQIDGGTDHKGNNVRDGGQGDRWPSLGLVRLG